MWSTDSRLGDGSDWGTGMGSDISDRPVGGEPGSVATVSRRAEGCNARGLPGGGESGPEIDTDGIDTHASCWTDAGS